MPRYVDAKDVKKRADCYLPEIRNVVANILRHTKTADVVERKVGKWECSDDIFEYALCSCCKWDSGEAWEYALKRFRFCPNCGARMKGEDDE